MKVDVGIFALLARVAALPQGCHATVKDYFEFLQNRVVVQFKPRELDPRLPEHQNQEFELELAKKMPYDVVAERVAQRLDAEPMKLRFSTQTSQASASRNTIKRAPGVTLSTMLHQSYGPHNPNVLYYEILDIAITEFEVKKYMKITFLDSQLKEQPIADPPLVPKNGTVADIIEALKPKVKLSENGTGKIRLFEVNNGKLGKEYVPEDLIKDISDSTNLYAEVR